jgi:hypothetical protein
MEAASHAHEHEHHAMPTEGNALTGVAISATLHCLTGCAIGEVLGVVIGTAIGLSDGATIALAIGLAFLFGYGLTSLPLLRAGLAFGAVVSIALASDTLSIATMEIVDNAILLAVPGAMDAGLGSVLFWGSLAFALVIAGVVAMPVNRWLIARGKGHAVVHETGIHGGPPVRVVGIVAVVAFVFGSAVLVAEAFTGEDEMHADGESAMAAEGSGEAEGMSMAGEETHEASSGAAEHGSAVDKVRGLASTEAGMTLELKRATVEAGHPAELSFRIVGEDGEPVGDYDVVHERQMHLILVRRDLTGFQHLHPKLGADGTWTTPVTINQPGSYRVFADFSRDGEPVTLASDLFVDGSANYRSLPAPTHVADAGGGHRVGLDAARPTAATDSELSFTVTRNGKPVTVQDYLGAGGHLVALREGDLAFLHVHPVSEQAPAAGEPITFETEFPSAGRYRLFLQFKRGGDVHTAGFTQVVTG